MANTSTAERKKKRGLASADQETRSRVAQLGGRAVSEDRRHMAEIGRKGGQASHRRGRSVS